MGKVGVEGRVGMVKEVFFRFFFFWGREGCWIINRGYIFDGFVKRRYRLRK